MGGFALVAALAQAVPSLDSGFARIRANQPGPAVAIAVWSNGQVVYRNAAGFSDLEHQVQATTATRFDWASIAKQFTAFAISLLVQQGRLAPGDPVAKYLPELELGGASLTIEHLLYHTAGLEDSDGLPALAGGKPGDRMTLDATVRLMLGQRHVRFPPGERSTYVNTGYLLLAEIVARVAGRNFAAWTDSAVFRPLGLRETGFLDRPERLVPNRALPYVADRGAGFLGSVDEATPGAGGLYGTVGDLVAWADHVMAPRYQREATLRLRTRGTLLSGERLGYAWGLVWGEYRGQVTLSHGGSGPASNAFLLMFPELGFAVAAASAGETDPSVSAMAFRAADHFLADRLKPVVLDTAPRRAIMLTDQALNEQPKESEGVIVDRRVAARYPGIYRFDDGSFEVIRFRGDRVEMSWGGRPYYVPLWPLPDGRFALVPLWNAYRFLVDSTGAVTGVAVEKTAKSLRRDGPDRRIGRRMPDRHFDAVSAAPYLGLYYSDELETVYRVALADSSLVLRHPRHGAMRLVPLEGDAFGVDGRHLAAVRFGRAGSRVVGLELEAVSWGATGSFRKLADPPPD
ncbi:MAG: serine hydrolase domain-containing protein [Gemmatimonadales bacterium]|nr:serine hydrolase domain-containing protein [Gemmatimonadales bacterium]